MKLPKIIFFLLLTPVFSVNAATVTFSDTSSTVGLGDIFTIDVIGQDFSTNVDGGGFNLGFDETVLNVLSVSIDETVWDFGGLGISTGSINNTNGTVDGVLVNAVSDVTGTFVVATIEFQAVATGVSSLGLSDYLLNPWASAGVALNPDYGNATVSVVAIPVPAALWFFGAGLTGFFGLARRKK